MFAEIVHSPSTNHVTSRLQITVWKHLYLLWTCKYLCNFGGFLIQSKWKIMSYPEKSINSNFDQSFSVFCMMRHDIDRKNICEINKYRCNKLYCIEENKYINWLCGKFQESMIVNSSLSISIKYIWNWYCQWDFRFIAKSNINIISSLDIQLWKIKEYVMSNYYVYHTWNIFSWQQSSAETSNFLYAI